MAEAVLPTVLGECEDRRRQAKAARMRYEADWFLNLAFFQGQQWVAWDGTRLYRPRMPKNSLTLTDNRVQPIVRTEVAKLTKARPGWAATPRDGDDRSVQHALTSERLVDSAYDSLDVAYHRREGVLWSRVTGAGFTKTTWDATAGAGVDVLVKANGDPIRNPATKRVARKGELPELETMDGVGTKSIGTGDVRIETRSPFEIFPDPLATGMDDLRWLIDESICSPEYVKARFGQDVKPNAPAQVGVVESRLLGAAASAEGGGENIGVRVFEMWEAPTTENPHGRYVAWTTGVLLEDTVNAYGRIPYDMWVGIPVPGRFWPDSVVTHLRPVQARRNKLLSQICENAARTANAPLLIDEMSNIKFTGAIGEQIMYQGGLGEKPLYLQPPAIQQYVFQLLQETENAMREISGQYEAASSSVPAGVTAASAISLLQEQDATRLGPDVEAMENTLGRIGQAVINIIARHYTTDRVIVVAGEDGALDIDSWRTSADFAVPDVKVVYMSTFPRSLAGKQAAIRDTLNLLLQYGVPISADALARTLRDMQVGGLEKIVYSFTADQAQVNREQLDFLRGIDPEVNPLVDNFEIHLAGHKDFAKTPRFAALPPKRQRVWFEHIKATEDAKTEAAMKAMLEAQPPAPELPPGTVPTEPSGNPAPMGDLSAFAAQSTV